MFWGAPVLSRALARAVLAGVRRRDPFAFPPVAQTSAPPSLPPVTVEPLNERSSTARPPQPSGARATRVPSASTPAVAPVASDLARGPALTVLTVQQALRDIQQTPGGVAIVPAEAYRNSTVANTIKDILDYVPGVFAQPKWGDDTGSRSAAPACRAISICAASNSTWTEFRSTRPTATATSRRSIRPPTDMSRSTRAPMPCNSAPTRLAARSIS